MRQKRVHCPYFYSLRPLNLTCIGAPVRHRTYHLSSENVIAFSCAIKADIIIIIIIFFFFVFFFFKYLKGDPKFDEILVLGYRKTFIHSFILTRYLKGSLPYVWRYITVNKIFPSCQNLKFFHRAMTRMSQWLLFRFRRKRHVHQGRDGD